MVNVLMNQKYTNGVPTVENLRKQGYKVRVYHGRCFGDYNEFVDRTFAISKKDVLTAPYQNKFGISIESDKLSCFGGFTRVELTTPDGNYTSFGKFNFGNRQFNRKIGLQAAIGRALVNMNI